MSADWKTRIEDPAGGPATLRASGIPVELVLELLASGWSIERLLRERPALSEDDVRACVAFGAESMRRLYVIQKIQRGMADVRAGRVIPDEELDDWLERHGAGEDE